MSLYERLQREIRGLRTLKKSTLHRHALKHCKYLIGFERHLNSAAGFVSQDAIFDDELLHLNCTLHEHGFVIIIAID